MDKAALKQAYKDTPRPMGVYKITVAQHGTVYLGHGVDLPARFNRHRAQLKFGSHLNKDLQALWNAQGEAAFSFEVIDLLDQETETPAKPEEELRLLAEMWAQKLESAGSIVARL